MVVESTSADVLSPESAAQEPSRLGGDDPWAGLAKQLRPRLTLAVNSLLRLVLKRSENPGYAEDIVSEAITAAYEKRQMYDPIRGQLYPWLLQIARNRTFDFLRRHRELRSERSFDEGFDAPSPPADEDELLYDQDAQPTPRTLALRRALKRLRPYDQEILIGRFGNTLDYDELERYFNFTVKKSTLRVHVKRAQSRLRRELAKEPAFKELFGDE
jgi:RNA polymerase sigma factor (sigma-70 family)